MKLDTCSQCGAMLGIVRTYWTCRICCPICGWSEPLDAVAISAEQADYKALVEQARATE